MNEEDLNDETLIERLEERAEAAVYDGDDYTLVTLLREAATRIKILELELHDA